MNRIDCAERAFIQAFCRRIQELTVPGKPAFLPSSPRKGPNKQQIKVMTTIPPLIEHTPSATQPAQPFREPFPGLNSNGPAVDPTQLVEKGTSGTVALAYIISVIGVIVGGLLTWGLVWLGLLIAPLADYFNRKKTMALIRGSGIQVGPQQFPEIYNCAAGFAQRLGMNELPEIFIVEGNVINAAAMRVGGRKVIILLDDIVDACLRSGDPQTLAFILGHEMAHHALGHTGLIRSMFGMSLKKLSRLDEFSCDAVANQLVGNPRTSARALTTMLSGPQLIRYIDLAQLAVQASAVASDKHSVKAERRLSHPLLLRRIQRFNS